MKLYTDKDIKDVLINKGYKPTSLNKDVVSLYAVRSNNYFTNKFDDLLVWIVNSEIKYARCTTDPGMYYLKHPSNEAGTAIIKEGQYEDTYKLGLHKGLYLALVQNKPITVWRDDNKDLTLDKKEDQTGFFGINIHRANSEMETEQVDKWSAGCVVVSNPFKFNELIKDVKNQIINAKYMYFTLTVLHENDFLNNKETDKNNTNTK